MILGSGVDRHLRTLAAAPAVAPFPQLAPREREILDLVAAGLSNIGHRRPVVPVTEDGRQLPDDGVRQAVRQGPHARDDCGP